jgi:hypothetical protein
MTSEGTVRLPRGLKFMIVRRISQNLAWVYAKYESGQGHFFLERGGQLLPCDDMVIRKRSKQSVGSSYELTRRAA